MTEPRDDWDAILDEHREFVEYFFADADEDVTGEELVALLLEQERDAADRMAGDPRHVSRPTTSPAPPREPPGDSSPHCFSVPTPPPPN